MMAHTRIRTNGRFRAIAAAAALSALAGCGSMHPTGDGAVVPAGGYLATIRTENGLAALSADPALERAALQQAGYMAETRKMAHTTRLGRDFASRLKDNGIRGAAAENIASGQKDLGTLFTAWKNSSGHRRNMLDPRFSKYGLAYVAEGESGRRYWALVLGR